MEVLAWLAPGMFVGFLMSALVMMMALFIRSNWNPDCIWMQVALAGLTGLSVAAMAPAVLLFMVQGAPITEAAAAVGGMMTLGIPIVMLGMRQLQLSTLLCNLPISHIRSAAVGLVRMCGVTNPHLGCVTTFTGGTPCLCYREVTDVYMRTVETYYDPETKRHRQRNVDRWTVVHGTGGRTDFMLNDGTGEALVHADGADFKCCHMRSYYNGWETSLFPPVPCLGDRRTVVSYMEPVTQVFIWGRWGLDGLERDEHHRVYVISEGSEDDLRGSGTVGASMLLVLGLGLVLGALGKLLVAVVVGGRG